MELEAQEARAGARVDDGTDDARALAEDDGKVRHVTPEPHTVERGRDNVCGDDDREVGSRVGEVAQLADNRHVHGITTERSRENLDELAPTA
jgi:hypothetical protein